MDVLLFVALLLLTGCLKVPEDPVVDSTNNEATNGAMNGAQGCEPACEEGQQCDVENDRCVECVGDDDCDGAATACDVASGTCVTCSDTNAEACGEGVCDLATHECVDCLEDSDCGGNTPACAEQTCVECAATNDTACTGSICDAETNACVECLENDDCTEPGASRCEANDCVSCSTADDCSHLPDRAICDTDIDGGTCVGCYPWSEKADCGTTFCDAATNVCTQTEFGATTGCSACTADDECVAGHRCVPMEFQGADHGSYCLPIKEPQEGCPRPFGGGVVARTSTSGIADLEYCGILETLTTCEAVLGFGDDCPGGAGDCGDSDLNDGRCEVIAGGQPVCTYSCSLDRECESGRECDGAVGDKYCG